MISDESALLEQVIRDTEQMSLLEEEEEESEEELEDGKEDEKRKEDGAQPLEESESCINYM